MSFRRWIELESDPGLFTLLVYDFGVKGVEVEEVYDLSKQMEKHVYGFIFLFKWTEERKTRRKAVVLEENFVKDERIENDMFFAQQIIPNSCASHALLSVLLNVPNVSLGYTLKQLRDSCKGFDSESKGLAIGNFWNIAVAHNNHGRPDLRFTADRAKNVTSGRSMEAFHYASYIPYNGHLYELDGLKPHPIDHGPWLENESWTDKARRVIQDRIFFATGGELSHDIRYNLLAVVPEQRNFYKEKIEVLQHNKKVLIEIFKNLADKESFVVEAPLNYVIPQSDPVHPFHKLNDTRPESKKKKRSGGNSKKSVTFNDELPVSPGSGSCVSTITGTESAHRPFSDSDCESGCEGYRIKSIIRGRPPVVYVKGEFESDQEEKENEGEPSIFDKNKIEPEKSECEDRENETEIKPNIEHNDVNNEQFEISVDRSLTSGIHDSLKRKTCEVSGWNENKIFRIDDDESNKKVENIKRDETAKYAAAENENKEIKDQNQPQSINDITTMKQVGSLGTKEEVNRATSTQCLCERTDKKLKQQVEEIKPKEKILPDAKKTSGVIDINVMLDQKKMEKLSLDNLLVHQNFITLPHLQKCLLELDELYKKISNSYKEELEKIERYKVDDCRRRHNYEPFVATFLSMLAEQGHLTTLLEKQNNQNAALKQKKELLKKKKKAFKKK